MYLWQRTGGEDTGGAGGFFPSVSRTKSWYQVQTYSWGSWWWRRAFDALAYACRRSKSYSRGRWRRRCTTLAASVQHHLDTFLLVLDWHSVEVPLAIVVDWTCPELRAAVVTGTTIWADREAVRWSSSLVTLPLGGRWSQNAATSLVVVEATILDAVGCWCVRTDTVLAILREISFILLRSHLQSTYIELAKCAGDTT